MAGNKLGRLASVGVLLLWGALSLLSCQQQAAPASPTVAPAPQAPAAQSAPAAGAETLKVGIMASLTGQSARVGVSLDRFIRMALDDLNAKGGVSVGGKHYRFESVTVDDKSTADGGLQAANRLVLAEKVHFILGSITATTAGAQTVTDPNKVLLFAHAAADKSLGKSFPLTFQVSLGHNIMRSAALLQWLAKERPQAKRIGFLMTDDITGRSIADVAEAQIKQQGMTPLSKEFFPGDIKDFSPLVTRVLREQPDAIITVAGGRGDLYLAMMQALNQAGFTGPVLGTSGDVSAMKQGAAFTKLFVAANIADWRVPIVGDVEKQIAQRYIDQYGEADLELLAASTYTMPGLLAQALEQAGTVDDATKVAQTLRDGTWDTIWSQKWQKSRFVGAQTFGLPAVLEQPIYLSKVEGGQLSTFDAFKGTLP